MNFKNNDWIPVDKRLPDNSDHVWLSFTNEYCSYVKHAIWDYDKFVWLNGKEIKDKPVAWRQYCTPEPYNI